MTSFATTFVFPIGKTLGGANIWSSRMCGHLEARGVATAAIMHLNPGWHPDGDLPIPEGTRVLTCGGRSVVDARKNDIGLYAESYEKTLPATLVPNWNDGCYAVCAELAKSRASDMRVIGVVHGNNDSYYDPLVRYESIIHCFIAVSEEIATELRKRLPHRAPDIHTKACPVEVPDTLERAPREKGRPIVLTYAGRITNHEKKVSDLAPLIRELDRQGVDFRFRIIGEGGYLETLKWEVHELPEDLKSKVSLEGIYPPDKMAGIWRESDICILVSSSEGTSISMLEAMAGGCVPVVTRVSGTAAVIDEGVTGFTVEVGDLPAMASHIDRLARQPDEWTKVSRAAYATARERYSYPDYVDWFVERNDEAVQADPRAWPADRKTLYRPSAFSQSVRKLFARWTG